MPSEPRRLHPASLLFIVGRAARQLLLPGLFFVFISRGTGYELFLFVMFLPAVGFAALKYWAYRYRLGDDELMITDGILQRNERHIPYDRIQNIDLAQNPLHRLLDVAEVRLQTAGGEEPEATMRVLSLAEVQEIRRHVFAGRRQPGAAEGRETEGAADEPAEAGGTLLHSMSPRDVFLFGIISNQGMVVVAAAMGLVWQLDLFDQWLDDARWLKVLKETSPSWTHGWAAAVLLAVAGIVAFVLVLRVLSVAWAFFKLYGFRLQRFGADLRADYGLVTRVSKTTPRHRIQLVSVVETPLHRLFGQAAAQIATAGSAKSSDDDSAASDRLWLAPLVARERVAGLLRTAVPELDPSDLDWQPPAPGARARLLRRSLLLLVPLAVAGVVAFGPWGLVPAVALTPLAWLSATRRVRYMAYALAPQAVFYRSGWWVRRLSATRFDKIQALELTQSPFDRRCRMASVRVDTAGAGRIAHSISIPLLEAAAAADLRDRLGREAGRTAFRW